jgi:hypothetical protein
VKNRLSAAEKMAENWEFAAKTAEKSANFNVSASYAENSPRIDGNSSFFGKFDPKWPEIPQNSSNFDDFSANLGEISADLDEISVNLDENRKKTPENGSKIAEDREKTAENGKKTPQIVLFSRLLRREKIENLKLKALLRAEIAKNESKLTENGSKPVENGSNFTKNGSKTTENGPKTTDFDDFSSQIGENSSKSAEIGENRSENTEKSTQNAEKSPQNYPISPFSAQNSLFISLENARLKSHIKTLSLSHKNSLSALEKSLFSLENDRRNLRSALALSQNSAISAHFSPNLDSISDFSENSASEGGKFFGNLPVFNELEAEKARKRAEIDSELAQVGEEVRKWALEGLVGPFGVVEGVEVRV